MHEKSPCALRGAVHTLAHEGHGLSYSCVIGSLVIDHSPVLKRIQRGHFLFCVPSFTNCPCSGVSVEVPGDALLILGSLHEWLPWQTPAQPVRQRMRRHMAAAPISGRWTWSRRPALGRPARQSGRCSSGRSGRWHRRSSSMNSSGSWSSWISPWLMTKCIIADTKYLSSLFHVIYLISHKNLYLKGFFKAKFIHIKSIFLHKFRVIHMDTIENTYVTLSILSHHVYRYYQYHLNIF